MPELSIFGHFSFEIFEAIFRSTSRDAGGIIQKTNRVVMDKNIA